MKKVVKLTEKDLTRLIKRVINEGTPLQTINEKLKVSDYVKNNPNVKGNFEVLNGTLLLTENNLSYTEIIP